MKTNRILFTVCCMAMTGFTAVAQKQSDKKDRELNFNAKEYLMQKRYIPTGRYIDKNAKGLNFSVGAFGGVKKLYGSGAGLIKEFGVSVTKDVNSFNSYRFSVMGGFNNTLKNGGMEIDHIFRIQDYLTGWNPKRNFFIETVWGLGMYYTSSDIGDNKLSGGVHAGLIFNRRISRNLSIFAEPKMYVLSDGFDGIVNERKYDMGFQAIAGFKYNFTGYDYIHIKNKDWADNLFYEVSVGTSGMFNTADKFSASSMGALGTLALGKWFYPLGIRAAGFGGWRNLPVNSYASINKEPFIGVRIEGMVNLNTFFGIYDNDPKFELNLTGGYELGMLAHRGTDYSSKVRVYNGPTAAMQALYFVKPYLGIFAQARYSRDYYDQPYNNGIIESRVLSNINLEIGLQYRRKYDKVKEVRDKYKFEPYNFISAQIGLNYPISSSSMSLSTIKEGTGQLYAISFGRRYSRIAAVRGTLEAARYKGKKITDYPLTVGADIMLDMFSGIGGYNPERIVNIYPFAGIVFAHSQTGDFNKFGVRGGIDAVINVSDRWAVFVQGDMRMYKGQISSNAKVFTSARLSMVPNISSGVMYKF